jgi:hypothetical protein
VQDVKPNHAAYERSDFQPHSGPNNAPTHQKPNDACPHRKSNHVRSHPAADHAAIFAPDRLPVPVPINKVANIFPFRHANRIAYRYTQRWALCDTLPPSIVFSNGFA